MNDHPDLIMVRQVLANPATRRALAYAFKEGWGASTRYHCPDVGPGFGVKDNPRDAFQQWLEDITRA